MVEAITSTAPRNTCRRTENGFTGHEFRKQVELLGIREVLSAPRSRWQRLYAEHVIASIRRECLDHVLIFDERLYVRRYVRISGITADPAPVHGEFVLTPPPVFDRVHDNVAANERM